VRLRVDADRFYGVSQPPKAIQGNFWGDLRDVYLHGENGRLVASPRAHSHRAECNAMEDAHRRVVAALSEPVAYFFAGNMQPIHRGASQERIMGRGLRFPKKGPPRPDPPWQ